MIWSMFQSYVVEIGVLVAIVGFLYESQRRFNKGFNADYKRDRKDMTEALNAVIEQQKEDSERLKQVDERLKQVEEKQNADSERLKQVDERLKRVEEKQNADSERLKQVEERQIKGEEQTKGIGRSISALEKDIRAIWQPAFGSFFSKKPGQGSDNRPNDS